MFIERRKYPRISFNFPLKISSSDYDIVTETKDISGSGAYCTTNKKLSPMTKLKVTMLVPVKKNNKRTIKKITCKGIVVREEHSNNLPINKNDYYNIAIYFNEIKESDRKVILSYINSSNISQPA